MVFTHDFAKFIGRYRRDSCFADLDAGCVIGQHRRLGYGGAGGESHGHCGDHRVPGTRDVVHRPCNCRHAQILVLRTQRHAILAERHQQMLAAKLEANACQPIPVFRPDIVSQCCRQLREVGLEDGCAAVEEEGTEFGVDNDRRARRLTRSRIAAAMTGDDQNALVVVLENDCVGPRR